MFDWTAWYFPKGGTHQLQRDRSPNDAPSDPASHIGRARRAGYKLLNLDQTPVWYVLPCSHATKGFATPWNQTVIVRKAPTERAGETCWMKRRVELLQCYRSRSLADPFYTWVNLPCACCCV